MSQLQTPAEAKRIRDFARELGRIFRRIKKNEKPRQEKQQGQHPITSKEKSNAK